VARWPAHVAKVPPLCTKVVVVELKRMLVEKKVGKEVVGGRSATHLVPLMLKPLTKSIKSKIIFFYSFSKFLLFIYFEIFDFMTCNDGKQKHVVEKE
jgi:hypothetical protein